MHSCPSLISTLYFVAIVLASVKHAESSWMAAAVSLAVGANGADAGKLIVSCQWEQRWDWNRDALSCDVIFDCCNKRHVNGRPLNITHRTYEHREPSSISCFLHWSLSNAKEFTLTLVLSAFLCSSLLIHQFKDVAWEWTAPLWLVVGVSLVIGLTEDWLKACNLTWDTIFALIFFNFFFATWPYLNYPECLMREKCQTN